MEQKTTTGIVPIVVFTRVWGGLGLVFFGCGKGCSFAAGDFLAFPIHKNIGGNSPYVVRRYQFVLIGVLLQHNGPWLLEGLCPLQSIILYSVQRDVDHLEVRIRANFLIVLLRKLRSPFLTRWSPAGREVEKEIFRSIL